MTFPSSQDDIDVDAFRARTVLMRTAGCGHPALQEKRDLSVPPMRSTSFASGEKPDDRRNQQHDEDHPALRLHISRGLRFGNGACRQKKPRSEFQHSDAPPICLSCHHATIFRGKKQPCIDSRPLSMLCLSQRSHETGWKDHEKVFKLL